MTLGKRFLGIWIRSVLENRPFEVWGGEQLRDLTYVDDATEAFLLAATTQQCYGKIFNIGGAPPASLRTLADLAVSHRRPSRAHYTVREFPADRAQIDIGSYHADDSAFRAATGWMPQVALEDRCIRQTIEWYRSQAGTLSASLRPRAGTGAA